MDEELAKKVFEEEQAKAMVEQEQERINFEAALELQKQLDEREELNRPYSVAEVRKNMVMYLKNQGGYKMIYFKGMKCEDIRPIFEKVWDQIQSFAPMDSEKEKDSEKKGSRKKSLARKRAGEKPSEESIKRQKIEDDIEELKVYLDLVPREEFAMEIESLGTKYPIVDWKTHVLTENFMYYQIIRADGGSKNYKIFSEMLDDFDRQDLMDLHGLVEEMSSGEIDRYKSRLVTQDFEQKEGIDYEDTVSPVVKMVTIRCLLNIVVFMSWLVFQLDVNNTFLYGDLEE
ncbi:putative ribonuclease H-like domain-containing protein, partial [Tanacetum coccineum]